MIPRHDLGAQKNGGVSRPQKENKECPANTGFENTICLEFTGSLWDIIPKYILRNILISKAVRFALIDLYFQYPVTMSSMFKFVTLKCTWERWSEYVRKQVRLN